MTLKVLELFGGIGAPRAALEKLDVDFKIVDYVEIDKFAVNSYNAIYNENYKPQDITKWDKNLDVDMVFHGSPCQDFSLAGQQAGGERESGTRSSLMWHTVRIVDKLKPRYVIWENVKNVLSKRHKPTFDKYIDKMSDLGYSSYYQVLNAKHYGVPQNRERVFVISILGRHQMYLFPQKQELKLRLKDLLEDDVDEKYYLSKEIHDRLIFKPNLKNQIKTLGTTNPNRTIGQRDIIYSVDGIMETLTATDYKQPKQVGIVQVAQYDTPTRKNSNRFRTYDPNGLSPSLSTMGGGGLEPHIPVVNATKKGYLEAREGDGVDLAYPNSKQRRGRVQHGISQTITTDDSKAVVVLEPKTEFGRLGAQACDTVNDNVINNHDTVDPWNKKISSKDGVVPTLTTRPEGLKTAVLVYNELRIRKLTPKECWRLMDFDDEQFDKAQAVNSNTQLYKQAGNSIVVNVLVELLKPLCDEWLIDSFIYF